MKNFLFHLTFLGFCLANLFSCTNPLETGSELLDDDLINVQNIDTFKITSTTIPGDSLLVYSIPTTASSGLINRYFFGKLNDPIFGITDVVIQSQLVPVVQLHPGLKIKVDSLVLVLPYSKDYLYGNKAQRFDLEIRELADSFKLDVNYFSTQKLPAKSSVVFGTSFVPNLDSVKVIDLSIGAKTELKLPAQLRVKFNDTDNFVDRLLAIDTAIYRNRTKFLKAIYGLQLRATNSGKGLAAFDLSSSNAGLYLYYQDVSGTTPVLAQYKYAFAFVVGESIERDRGTSLLGKYLKEEPNQEYVLLQGQEGSSGKFSIPGLKNLKNVLIHKAELVVKVASIEGDEPAFFTPSPRLLATYRDSKGTLNLVRDFNLASQSSSLNQIYNGLYTSGVNNEPGTYTINLTSHVQDIIAGKAPSDIILKAFPLAESAARTTLYRADHPVHGAKLKLYYTQLNQ